MLKIAYFGIDALQECLAALLAHGCEVVCIFTTEDDGYDSGQAIRAFAREHGIPCRTTRVTREEIRALEEQGGLYHHGGLSLVHSGLPGHPPGELPPILPAGGQRTLAHANGPAPGGAFRGDPAQDF